jgi:crotonobetainyl-CoA:carnitine CoA-transferase CaiB-like acyl-CoA transferase
MSVRDDADWERFAAALGNPDWTQDHALSGLAGRQQAHVGLDAHIAHWATQRSAADAEQILAGAGIPVCALPEPLDYLDNPQLRHRGYYQTMEHPVTGSEPYPGWPVQITPGPVDQHRFVAPTLGQHNDELLTERLGLSADDIESMRRRRITGTVPLGLAAEAGR